MKKPVLLILIFLSLSHIAFGQCKEQKKPNKWLYKAAFSRDRFTVSNPAQVNYATKIVLFFDAFVFHGLYSLTKSGENAFFYLNFHGPASYPYEVTVKDSLHFCFSDGQVIKLAPSANHLGTKGDLIAFYDLEDQFLSTMASVSLDSISLKFTPRPLRMPDDGSQLENSYTFKHFSKKHVAGFKNTASCFGNMLDH